jgi:hypothetical protein
LGLLASLALAASCGDDAPPAPPPAPGLAASGTTAPGAPESESAGASPGAAAGGAPLAARTVPSRPPPRALSIADLGHPCGEAERSDEASAANTAALVAHGAADYAAARDGFARASALAPTWSTPRFNLACALARLGDLEGAAAAIEPALLRDLPETLERLAQDPDLEPLRAEERAPAFHARVERIRELHRDAVRDGLVASCGGRYGVYLRASDRFVALSTATGDHGRVDRAHERVAVIAAGIVGESETDEVFALESVSVAPFVPLRGGWASSPRSTYSVPAGGTQMADPTELEHAFDLRGTEARFERMGCDARWCTVRGRALVPAVNQAELPAGGSSAPPAGVSLAADALTIDGAEPIALGAGHADARWHTFALDPSRRHVVVASDELVEESGTYVAFEQSGDLHHTVFDHVDLETRVVTRLGEADDVGWTVADGEDVYTVLGHSVRRWPRFSPTHYVEVGPLVPLPEP